MGNSAEKCEHCGEIWNYQGMIHTSAGYFCDKECFEKAGMVYCIDCGEAFNEKEDSKHSIPRDIDSEARYCHDKEGYICVGCLYEHISACGSCADGMIEDFRIELRKTRKQLEEKNEGRDVIKEELKMEMIEKIKNL